jgi:hypothetical protein
MVYPKVLRVKKRIYKDLGVDGGANLDSEP